LNLLIIRVFVFQIETGKVFSNIVDVYYATCHFWVNHTSQVLRVARETREPLNPCLLKSGFLVVGFHVYCRCYVGI